MISDDGLLGAPTCPDCMVTLRERPGEWYCPVCGHLVEVPAVVMPPEDDIPTIGW